MIFSSSVFLFWFLPWVLLLVWGVPQRLRNLLLTVCSYLFYGWANPAFVLLMLASTVVDFCCGLMLVSGQKVQEDGQYPALSRQVHRSRRQRLLLFCSVSVNLGVLGFFKYWNFGIEVWQQLLLQVSGTAVDVTGVLRVSLPLGISFYTFQSMSYCIDIYRGQARATRSFVDFACFVSLFPQLVAGPILKYRDLSEQLRTRRVSLVSIGTGAAFFTLGLARKVLLANPCGEASDLVFAAEAPGFSAAWIGTVFFAMQIYFDFSGYSDMARGLGLMLGFEFPANFRSPYRAESLTDFWRRWHITLSGWLRDYVYIPLGGNRRGALRTSVNLGTVMLLGGLWHGAAWNFLLWGAVHGAALIAERVLNISVLTRGPCSLLPAWLICWIRRTLVFLFLCFTWVLFRCGSTAEIGVMLGAMTGFRDAGPAAEILWTVLLQPWFVGVFSVAAAVLWLAPESEEFLQRITLVRAAWVLLLLPLTVCMMSAQTRNPFIYFLF